MEEDYELNEPAPAAPMGAAPSMTAGKAPAVKGALTEEMRRQKQEAEAKAAKVSHARIMIRYIRRGLIAGVVSMGLCWALQYTDWKLLIFFSMFVPAVLYAALLICPLNLEGDLDIDMNSLIWPMLWCVIPWGLAGILVILCDGMGSLMYAPLAGGLGVAIYLAVGHGDLPGAAAHFLAGMGTAAAIMFGLDMLLPMDEGKTYANFANEHYLMDHWSLWAVIIPWQTATGAAAGWIQIRK